MLTRDPFPAYADAEHIATLKTVKPVSLGGEKRTVHELYIKADTSGYIAKYTGDKALPGSPFAILVDSPHECADFVPVVHAKQPMKSQTKW